MWQGIENTPRRATELACDALQDTRVIVFIRSIPDTLPGRSETVELWPLPETAGTQAAWEPAGLL